MSIFNQLSLQFIFTVTHAPPASLLAIWIFPPCLSLKILLIFSPNPKCSVDISFDDL